MDKLYKIIGHMLGWFVVIIVIFGLAEIIITMARYLVRGML